jgi:hypothetical protein
MVENKMEVIDDLKIALEKNITKTFDKDGNIFIFSTSNNLN